MTHPIEGEAVERAIADLRAFADGDELLMDRRVPVLKRNTVTILTALEAANREAKGRAWHMAEAEQIAGKALGYPWFKDDQENFPGTTEADGVCIGEHVVDTIVAELAAALEASRVENEGLRLENADLKSSVKAFCAPWAVSYARERGLPEGHLLPGHYDILAKAGARMDDFVRGAALSRPLDGAGEEG